MSLLKMWWRRDRQCNRPSGSARREALMAAVDAASEAGLPSDAEVRLLDLLFVPLFDGFRLSLPGGSPAKVGHFQVKLKVDADFSKVEASPRVYSPAIAA